MRRLYPYVLVAALGFCPLTTANAMGMKSLATAGELLATGKSEAIDVSYKHGCYKRFSERKNRYIRVCDHRYKRYRYSNRYRYYRYYDFYPPYYYGYGPTAYFAFPGLNFYFGAPFHRHHHHFYMKRHKHY